LLADYGSIPLPMTLVLVDQLLDALSAVHAAGLVHRDVKPANLLLEPTGTGRPFLRLADFGIAVALDDPRLTVTGVVVGTPGYVAPEVAAGAAPDLRQDLWSVAVLARHLLTGVRPGTAPSGMPLDAEAQAPLPVHLPAEALAWIDWLGAPCLADRPSDAGAARLALRGLGCWTDPCWQPEEEAVEVFDHLAAWPSGWSPEGPVDAGRGWQPLIEATATPDPPTRPDARAGLDPPTRREPPPMRPAPAAGSDRRPGPAPRPAASRPEGRTRPAPSLGRLVQLVSAAVLVGIAVVAFLLAAQASDSADGVTPGGGGEPAAPAGRVEAGEDCPFSQVGQRRTTSGGDTITCRLEDGTYVWR